MKKIISTEKAPRAIGPYSQAVASGQLLFVSGQIAIDPKTGDFIDGDIEKQAEQVLKNLKAIIEAAGLALQDVLKCTCFLADMDDFIQFNGIYGSYFEDNPPARETVEVSRLPKGAKVEVSAICER